MPVMPDWGGGGKTGYQRGQDALNAFKPPAPPKAIARPPAPRPAPAPYQAGSNLGYIAPVQNYVPPVQTYQNFGPAQTLPYQYQPAVNYVQNAAPAAPPPPPPPPPPPRKTAEDFAKQYNTDDKVATVDSVFEGQRAQYKAALEKFIRDNDRQKKDVGKDTDIAEAGVERNRVAGLTSLTEDYAARGMAKSGLFLGNQKEAVNQYGRQKENVLLGEQRALEDLLSRRGKMESDTTNQIGAARREAYARLAANQDLV